MPLPKPRAGEQRENYIGRCMADAIMQTEYPAQRQRLAVCQSLWEDNPQPRRGRPPKHK